MEIKKKLKLKCAAECDDRLGVITMGGGMAEFTFTPQHFARKQR